MPDEIYEIQEALIAGLREAAKAFDRGRGVLAPTPAFPSPTNPHEGLSHTAPRPIQAFAAGYNSGTGTTILAFTTDVSILTDGSSGDILTT